jgi:hypothetical protein
MVTLPPITRTIAVLAAAAAEAVRAGGGCVDSCGGGVVNGADLGQLLIDWGADGCPGGPGNNDLSTDLNSDGVVDGADLGLLLLNFGPCP